MLRNQALMPASADCNTGLWAKAKPVMNSDIVNPIPARHPKDQRWSQDTRESNVASSPRLTVKGFAPPS